jgi:hypothetical protein
MFSWVDGDTIAMMVDEFSDTAEFLTAQFVEAAHLRVLAAAAVACEKGIMFRGRM